MVRAEEILSYWLDEVGPAGWYAVDQNIDDTIRERFGQAWRAACDGTYALWLTYPSGALAYTILMDQFPRNMFRGSAEAFASDSAALAAAKNAIDHGWDLKIDEPARQFFYMPLMHSENLCDQERCVRLMCARMPDSGAGNLVHAKAHREVIREFGRFPYRNQALHRHDTVTESEFLASGGYGNKVRELQNS
ncbi:hypothetical protein TG4357_00374 [Thalassovita gelatinovora]|uniref:DUF924 domain-containing protein n=1 Tax=Thalassovita gelatinovora TaxID=53501 RepID=A0A0P1FQX0_THAGE|nr:DUF924 family protein [Thalassovita gelatinovora]QIZ79499.1 DUF924 domain-containing protein [Thalassovita gelatinovora]CUH62917.1 hypothetical protein TG4357_00374 [Thalassovita gelatinovora]SEQ12361.1 Uncharacterized conserved protein, DUF924 family [Thalassovita gelatinovora]